MSIDSGPTTELLPVAEVAGLLNSTVASVRHLQHQRKIPFVRVGGSIRFFRSDIASYLEKRRVLSID
jgi:excisionase family DNA binding protein